MISYCAEISITTVHKYWYDYKLIKIWEINYNAVSTALAAGGSLP